MKRIFVARKSQNLIVPRLLESMFHMRRRQFADRLRWRVDVDSSGRESDCYDLLDPLYVLAADGDGSCVGRLRLLPTNGPNMLQDLFSDLVTRELECNASVWEVSRFAVAPGESSACAAFGPTATALMRVMVAEARSQQICALVGATSTSIVRLLGAFGFDVELLGAPAVVYGTRSVAFRLPLTEAVTTRITGAVS
jgi:acyl homoserine lactone synthase